MPQFSLRALIDKHLKGHPDVPKETTVRILRLIEIVTMVAERGRVPDRFDERHGIVAGAADSDRVKRG